MGRVYPGVFSDLFSSSLFSSLLFFYGAYEMDEITFWKQPSFSKSYFGSAIWAFELGRSVRLFEYDGKWETLEGKGSSDFESLEIDILGSGPKLCSS